MQSQLGRLPGFGLPTGLRSMLWGKEFCVLGGARIFSSRDSESRIFRTWRSQVEHFSKNRALGFGFTGSLWVMRTTEVA